MTTQALDLNSPDARVLRALFELARLDRAASASLLASCLGMTPTQVAEALVALEGRGLVRPERARLTFHGLAMATRIPALDLVPPVHTPELVLVPPRARGLAKVAPLRLGARRSQVVNRRVCH